MANKEAADAIQKVISRYGYAPEFLGLEKQVGAADSSGESIAGIRRKAKRVVVAANGKTDLSGAKIVIGSPE